MGTWEHLLYPNYYSLLHSSLEAEQGRSANYGDAKKFQKRLGHPFPLGMFWGRTLKKKNV